MEGGGSSSVQVVPASPHSFDQLLDSLDRVKGVEDRVEGVARMDSQARAKGLAATTPHISQENDGVLVSRCVSAIPGHLIPYLQELDSWSGHSEHTPARMAPACPFPVHHSLPHPSTLPAYTKTIQTAAIPSPSPPVTLPPPTAYPSTHPKTTCA